MLAIAEMMILAAFAVFMGLMLITVVNRNRRQQETSHASGSDVYADIRRRVANRYQRRGQFALHSVLFVFSSAAFWFIIPMPRTAALLLSGVWLLILIAHGVKVWFDEAQERAVDREIARMEGDGGWQKPKRTHLHLTDDGELVEVNGWDSDEKLKHDA